MLPEGLIFEKWPASDTKVTSPIGNTHSELTQIDRVTNPSRDLLFHNFFDVQLGTLIALIWAVCLAGGDHPTGSGWWQSELIRLHSSQF